MMRINSITFEQIFWHLTGMLTHEYRDGRRQRGRRLIFDGPRYLAVSNRLLLHSRAQQRRRLARFYRLARVPRWRIDP